MKKVSFVVKVVLMPLLVALFSYIFLQALEMRPIGVAISYALNDIIMLSILLVFFFCCIEQQIWEAIQRFDEERQSGRQENIEIQTIKESKVGNEDKRNKKVIN